MPNLKTMKDIESIRDRALWGKFNKKEEKLK
jgi:hypothetical protein